MIIIQPYNCNNQKLRFLGERREIAYKNLDKSDAFRAIRKKLSTPLNGTAKHIF